MNPFLLKGYNGPSSFCDREGETNTLINAVENQQDITLYAYRRLGKSALIHHVFHHLKKKYNCIYSDLWGTISLGGFTKELANAILKSDLISRKSFSKKVSEFIRAIGASISIGADGMPSIDVMYHDKSQTFRSLDEIFAFLEKLSVPVVLAIDEIQEIKKYGEVPLEAKLRSIVQQSKNIHFIFSGSEHHIINHIFNEYSQPFYQSTRMIALPKIPEEKYAAFIKKQFKKEKKQIQPEVIKYILEISYRHTYYVQAICNYLYSLDNAPGSISEFESLYFDYLLEKKVFYTEFPQRLSKQQFKCVKAFAKQGLVSSPTSGKFLEDSEVKNPSSMQRVIKSLINKQIIIKEDNAYRLYDVFLEHYLKYVI